MPLKDFRSVYLPYCIKKQEDGSFIVLNRNYKPLGFNSLDNVIYEDYPISSKIKGLTTVSIKKLAWNGVMKNNFIFLKILSPIYSLKLFIRKSFILVLLSLFSGAIL